MPHLTRPSSVQRLIMSAGGAGRRRRTYSTPPRSSPFSAQEYAERREQGEKWLAQGGYDLDATVEQPVVWGDLDAMQHLNNVQTLRYFESARMLTVRSMLPELPSEWEQSLTKGKPNGGPGVILASVSAQYRRPVYYPDTLLVSHRVSSIPASKDRFILSGVAWSLSQRARVSTSEADMVVFNYKTLKKMTIPDQLREALERRMRVPE